MDEDTTGDQRREHYRNPPVFLSTEELLAKTGVEFFKVKLQNLICCWFILRVIFKFEIGDEKSVEQLTALRKSRGYSYEDEITITESMADYEAKLKIFFTEHLQYVSLQAFST